MGLIVSWADTAQAVKLRAKAKQPNSLSVKELKAQLSDMVAAYNGRYGNCFHEFVSQQRSDRSMFGIDVDIERDDSGNAHVIPSSAAWWIIPERDIKEFATDAESAKSAIAKFWNKIDFDEDDPDKLFQAAMRIEFGSAATYMAARDTYPTIDGADFLDGCVGAHLIDPETLTEIDRNAKAGMAEMAHHIQVVAEHLKDIMSIRQAVENRAGRVLHKPEGGWGNRARDLEG